MAIKKTSASRKGAAQRRKLSPPQAKVIEESFKRNKNFIFQWALKISRETGVPFDELVSAGTIALVRAAPKYDPTKGYKELTYVGRAIRREMAQYVKKAQKSGSKKISLEDIPQRFHPATPSKIAELFGGLHEHDMQTLSKAFKGLTQIEVDIITSRFGIGKPPQTLEQIARRVGLSKQGVLIKQNNAIDLIRASFGLPDDMPKYRMHPRKK